MATIINSVAFENFYNYYGSYEQNEYKFKPGINIINADNNMGKSKFYNGFMWILRDQVYDSDIKAFVDANDSLIKMASGKARIEDQNFKVGVKIIFTNNKKIYTIEKYALFSNANGEIAPTPSVVEISVNENNRDMPIMDNAEKNDIINNIFIPLALRNYALLQGESMDRLVDLSSKKALSDTIDTLAGISVLKGICETSSKLSKRADKLYRDKDIENSDNNSARQSDIGKREQLLALIEKTEKFIEDDQKELDAAIATKEELDAYISNSNKRMEVRTKLEANKIEIKHTKESIANLESSITKNIFDEVCPWLLIGLSEELDVFKAKREQHIGDVAQLNNDGTLVIMLPEGSPDTSSLERMLKNEVCEVCGQPAAKHSKAWEHIKMILDRPKKKNTTRNDFKQFYGSLETSASSYSRTIPKIDEKIESTEINLDRMKGYLSELETKERDILVELSNAGGNADNSEQQDKSVISDYGVVSHTIPVKEKAINDKKRDIDLWRNSISQIEKRLSSSKNGTGAQKYADFATLMKTIEDIIIQTKDSIFDKTISALAKEANDKYMELTSGNQSSGGILQFEKTHDVVNVSIRDKTNGVITGLGTGFQRMKQLAIVMAVISSKIGGEKKFDYPFISDAPFSEFGENFINNFFNVAPNVFTQSIIMIKELYDPNSDDYLTSFGRKILEDMKSGKISGTFYVNVINDKTDTTGLVTLHKCYNY